MGGSAGARQLPGLDLELLRLADEAELTFPIESIHPELAHALGSDDEVIVGGEPFSPRLHILMYQIESASGRRPGGDLADSASACRARL